ncbi:ultraviolet-B receptor UVR8 isoform X5 [Humulus lupulus]|uniref:ultraviolet-B receptor UVR8 isoform X5 n=1 Tax=Humulus lupulus TaxID=3486 RepID=UPI002B406689|nr:ultraviolet-B receptor UVR8 isoform X5 [Humulus lupulus]
MLSRIGSVRSSSLNLGLGLVKRWLWSKSETGQRFAVVWGNGDYGRLGLQSLDSHWSPAPVLCSTFRDQGLRAIACGGAHTLFLTETGRVYATGLNDFGQLGTTDDAAYSTEMSPGKTIGSVRECSGLYTLKLILHLLKLIKEPVEVSGLPKEISQISAGYYHSSAITVDGELYMWGRNANGQLGLGKRALKAVPLPTKVESLIGLTIKMAALGSEHSIAVSDVGEVLSWGGGEYGRLGHGNDSTSFAFFKSTSEYTPRLIKKLEGIKVKYVAAGLLHSACIDENGLVFVFGERPADILVVENCTLGVQMKMDALVSVLLRSFINQNEFKVLSWNLL